MKNLSSLLGSLGAASLTALPTAAAPSAPAPKTNVLLIIADDLRPTLGCYGDALARTPHIDGLARQGVLFERAYCQQAICAPSRASFLSGLRPNSTGVHDLDHPLRQQKPDVRTLPQIFKEAGYETVSIGKVYHHGQDDAQSWTRRPNAANIEYAEAATLARQQQLKREAKGKGLSGLAAFQHSRGPAVESADVPDEAYGDGLITQRAVEQMKQLRGAPFLMCVGFRRPHLPFTAPKRYWDLYRREQFAVPPRQAPRGAAPQALANFGELRAYAGVAKQGPLSDEATRELAHGYYASTSFMDAQVGKLLGAVEELGLRERTLVVVMGDHGYKLGEYGSWNKHSNMEIDARSPLIVRAPTSLRAKTGAKSPALVEYVDLLPTLTDITGLPTPEECEGLSLRPLLSEPGRAWKKAAFSQYPRGNNVMGSSLRSGRWRYTEWKRGAELVARELYDHAAGPVADANLATSPEHAATVREMSALLAGGWKAALPAGVAPLPVAAP